MRKRLIIDKLALFIIILLSSITILPLFVILAYIIKQGIGIINWQFLTSLPKPVGESGGGIFNAILGTAIICLMAFFMAVPVGVGGGVYLSERRGGRFVELMRICIDILQGAPSIMLGIISYLWIVKPMGAFSALSGSVALAIMMLPAVVCNTEESLKRVPYSLREAAFALGIPYYKVILKVVIPSGLSGIITGVLIGIGRIAGETAPLLFTAFGSPHINLNPLKPMASLPLLIFNYALSPYPEWIKQAWGASVILCFMIFLLNLGSRIGTRRWKITL